MCDNKRLTRVWKVFTTYPRFGLSVASTYPVIVPWDEETYGYNQLNVPRDSYDNAFSHAPLQFRTEEAAMDYAQRYLDANLDYLRQRGYNICVKDFPVFATLEKVIEPQYPQFAYPENEVQAPTPSLQRAGRAPRQSYEPVSVPPPPTGMMQRIQAAALTSTQNHYRSLREWDYSDPTNSFAEQYAQEQSEPDGEEY